MTDNSSSGIDRVEVDELVESLAAKTGVDVDDVEVIIDQTLMFIMEKRIDRVRSQETDSDHRG